MAKTTKTRKHSPDTSEMKSAAKLKPVMDDDDDDDDEETNEDTAPNVSASENEDGSDDERRHKKLLDAISSLGGRKRKKLAERSEATIQMSEFTVNAEGEGDKINLSDLIGTMEKTSTVSTKTKKQLKNLHFSPGTVDCPLSKQETERIQREVAFKKTAEEVSRWQSVVKQNQRAEQLVFPLNQEPSGPKAMAQVVAGWKAQTPLEEEIFSLLNANKQPVYDPVLTPMEEASLRAMSLGEAKIRRAELQKARALQSYYEAKAARERRIKSKKYHRVQNKSKRKEFLKQFDEMVKTDPSAALEELNKMELSRMQERMSLKHQNSGKWARSKAIMAKYDEGARKAMQQQLALNKELTEKLVNPLNVEEEEEEEEDAPEVLPDFVNDAEPALDPTNPWMRGKLSAELTEQEPLDAEQGENDGEESVAAGPGMGVNSEEQEEEEPTEEPEEEVLLREFETRRKLRQAEESDTAPICLSDSEETETTKEDIVEADLCLEISESEEEEFADRHRETAVEQTKMVAALDAEQGQNDGGESVAAGPGMVVNSEEQEEEEPTKEEVLLPEFETRSKESDTAPICVNDGEDAEQGQNDGEESVAAGPGMVVNSEEQEEEEPTEEEVFLPEFETRSKESDTAPICVNDSEATTETVTPPPAPQKAVRQRKRKREIDLKEVLTKEAQVIKVPLAPTAVEDMEKKEEQITIIKEAFAGDDVISDFLKDKRKQEEAGKPKAVDLTLPGWGEWGGVGLQASRKKRRRFRVKAAPAPYRRDGHLPTVIISEKRNRSVSTHQVSSLPYPFENPKQFESTIRCPTGRTWNTQQTVKKITAPKVITRLGAIIEPITREELMKDKKQVVTGNKTR